MSPSPTLREELEAVRKGRGVQEPQTRNRMGPRLRRQCHVDSSTTHSDARQALIALLRKATDRLPVELQLAANAMFAIDDRYLQRFLRQRYEALAALWNCDFRTVQRRCDEALDLITDYLDQHEEGHTLAVGKSDVFDAESWYLERLGALLLLNRHSPEAIEERTLVASVDGLTQLEVAFGVPRHPQESRPELDLDMDILYGARLDSVHRPGDNMFVSRLILPRPLRYGERHTYVRTVRIPAGQLMVPRYVHLPLRRCDLLELRVKFRLDALPRAVWLVSRQPEMVYTNQRLGDERIQPDAIGEVYVRFTDLQVGFGYGVAWLPADGDHE